MRRFDPTGIEYGKFGHFNGFDRETSIKSLESYASNPCTDTLNAAVEANVRLAAWFTYNVIDRTYVPHLTDDQIYSVCCRAVLRAVQTYDPSREIQFSTYATSIMLRAITNEHIRETKQKARFPTSGSYDSIASRTQDHRQCCIESVEIHDAVEAVDEWVSTHISKRDRDILYCHRNGETYVSIGKRLKVTRERVRQINDRTIEKIRRQFPFVDEAFNEQGKRSDPAQS